MTSVRDINNQTPIHVSRAMNLVDITELLLAQGDAQSTSMASSKHFSPEDFAYTIQTTSALPMEAAVDAYDSDSSDDVNWAVTDPNTEPNAASTSVPASGEYIMTDGFLDEVENLSSAAEDDEGLV